MVVIVTAFSGLVMADYYLRHEATGQTRRSLKEQGVALNSDSVLQAAEAGNMEVIDSLQEAGLDLGDPGASGETALLVAVKSGNVRVIDFLLGKKSVARTLGHKDSDGQTALIVAVKEGDYSTAKKLIGLGARMGSHWEDGVPLITAAVENDDIRLFDFLIGQGVSVKEKDGKGLTSLVLAVKEKKKDWPLRLLKAGADANQAGVTDENLLMEAIQGGNTGLVKILIEYGATVDAKNKAGETALMVAVDKANREMIIMLLGSEAKTDVLDAKGGAIADRLIAAGDVEMVEFFTTNTEGRITDDWMVKVFEAGKTDLLQGLLKKGGSVEAETGKSGRLLKRAVLNKDLPMVELLLAFNADPKGEVWDALASGDREILKKLLISGADANEALALGVGSPLSLALRQRRYDSAEILLKHGADSDPQQADGKSLLEEAKSRLDDRAVSLLNDYCAGYREEMYSGDGFKDDDIKGDKRDKPER